MQIKPFALERYFARYEFSARYLLSSSDCDGLSLQEILDRADTETRNLWETLHLGYTESLGLPLLREEIASLYSNIALDQVITLAPEEGIFIAMNCLLRPGDNVICVSPGYQSLYAIAESLGCSVTPWEPEETQGWRFDPEFLAGAIVPETRLIVINFPHNPTGYYPTPDEFDRIIEIARAHDLFLFSDEMYRLLEPEGMVRHPAAVDVYEKAISLWGMSKTFGLAGLRLGWLVVPDRTLFASIAQFKDYTTICSSAPSEILALIGLRAKEPIVARHLLRIRRNLALADDFMGRHRDLIAWMPPKAGTVAFPRLRAGGAGEFCERAIQEAGILLLPSHVYGFGDDHFRLGLGRENFPEAINHLEQYLSR